MDQRASAVDQDLKDILHTRMAIAHKLNELEHPLSARREPPAGANPGPAIVRTERD